MDVGQFIFTNLYRATKLLVGIGASKVAGTPGLLTMLLDTNAGALAAPGATTLAAIPALELGMHSFHALVLFNALRASSKYGDMREQMRAIEKSMKDFMGPISEAIQATSPVPDSPPSAPAQTLLDGKGMAKFIQESNEWGGMVRTFVGNLDAILDDIVKCLDSWNDFLVKFRKFMETDKPRNIFESLERATLHRDRDWAWYSDETGFSAACNNLLSHRNLSAKLIGVASRGALPRLRFAD